MSTNWEGGLDFKAFGSRLELDVTYYYNRTKNQILNAPFDPTRVTKGYHQLGMCEQQRCGDYTPWYSCQDGKTGSGI